MTQSLFQSFGGFSLPITDEDTEGSLTALDPGRDKMLAWFKAAINAEFASVWTEATASLPSGHKLVGTQPVADTYPGEPSAAVIQGRKTGWPLLALHRTGEATYETELIDRDKLTQQWHLHYIIGPIDIEGERKILDICQAIGKLVAMCIRAFGHPAHESGADQLEAANLTSLRIVNSTGPGQAVFDEGDDTKFWATRIALESTELVDDVTAHEQGISGVDVSVDASGAGHPDVSHDFVEGQSDVAYQDP